MAANDFLRKSLSLSRSYWLFYESVIGPTNLNLERTPFFDQTCNLELGSQPSLPDLESSGSNIDTESGDENDELNKEYLKFIRITREHQARREKLKQLELNKKPEPKNEEYYIDISQLDTLIEDNLVEVPQRSDHPTQGYTDKKIERLVKLYGGQENYEKIRSMEMSIDENFNEMYRKLSPQYWPVIPFNLKPYLNPSL